MARGETCYACGHCRSKHEADGDCRARSCHCSEFMRVENPPPARDGETPSDEQASSGNEENRSHDGPRTPGHRMRYMRCKCGKSECWTTMGSPECLGCPECNTTLAETPDGHDTPIEHDWRDGWTIDEQTGERGRERVCLRCYKREVIAIEGSSTGRARSEESDTND